MLSFQTLIIKSNTRLQSLGTMLLRGPKRFLIEIILGASYIVILDVFLVTCLLFRGLVDLRIAHHASVKFLGLNLKRIFVLIKFWDSHPVNVILHQRYLLSYIFGTFKALWMVFILDRRYALSFIMLWTLWYLLKWLIFLLYLNGIQLIIFYTSSITFIWNIHIHLHKFILHLKISLPLYNLSIFVLLFLNSNLFLFLLHFS